MSAKSDHAHDGMSPFEREECMDRSRCPEVRSPCPPIYGAHDGLIGVGSGELTVRGLEDARMNFCFRQRVQIWSLHLYDPRKSAGFGHRQTVRQLRRWSLESILVDGAEQLVSDAFVIGLIDLFYQVEFGGLVGESFEIVTRNLTVRTKSFHLLMIGRTL